MVFFSLSAILSSSANSKFALHRGCLMGFFSLNASPCEGAWEQHSALKSSCYMHPPGRACRTEGSLQNVSLALLKLVQLRGSSQRDCHVTGMLTSLIAGIIAYLQALGMKAGSKVFLPGLHCSAIASYPGSEQGHGLPSESKVLASAGVS